MALELSTPEIDLDELWGDNEYLKAARGFVGDRFYELSEEKRAESYGARQELVEYYSFAMPTQEALELIAGLGPIIEVGAGSGYWASLLRQGGVEVVALDNRTWPEQHTEVLRVNHEVITAYPGYTLMLCWPPLKSKMAAQALQLYTGDYLIYIGENSHGACAEESFFAELKSKWKLKETVVIPTWPLMHDLVWLYQRKRKAKLSSTPPA